VLARATTGDNVDRTFQQPLIKRGLGVARDKHTTFTSDISKIRMARRGRNCNVRSTSRQYTTDSAQPRLTSSGTFRHFDTFHSLVSLSLFTSVAGQEPLSFHPKRGQAAAIRRNRPHCHLLGWPARVPVGRPRAGLGFITCDVLPSLGTHPPGVKVHEPGRVLGSRAGHCYCTKVLG
jgi:hypothetical protein